LKDERVYVVAIEKGKGVAVDYYCLDGGKEWGRKERRGRKGREGS
jgi:hypothetical protein